MYTDMVTLVVTYVLGAQAKLASALMESTETVGATAMGGFDSRSLELGKVPVGV